MTSTPLAVLRHLAACPPRGIVFQRRWARVHDVRFLATVQPSRAVLDRYRDRLEAKAQREGLDGISGLKSAYADLIEAQRKRDAVEPPGLEIPQAPNTPVTQPNRGPLPSEISPQNPSEKNPSERPPPDSKGKDPGSQYQEPSWPPPHGSRQTDQRTVKALHEILDLDKARELPEKELTAIWRLRHASSPQNICAVIPATTYRSMERLAHRSPRFVLPVPHNEQGAEIHYLQWTFDPASKTSTVLFTHLAEYKARGEFAQPHTSITHYLDLSDDKGLVLMRGHILDGRGVLPENAKWLVLCLQKFYGAWADEQQNISGLDKERITERRNLLEWFTSGDTRFSVEKLLEEAERLG